MYGVPSLIIHWFNSHTAEGAACQHLSPESLLNQQIDYGAGHINPHVLGVSREGLNWFLLLPVDSPFTVSTFWMDTREITCAQILDHGPLFDLFMFGIRICHGGLTDNGCVMSLTCRTQKELDSSCTKASRVKVKICLTPSSPNITSTLGK